MVIYSEDDAKNLKCHRTLDTAEEMNCLADKCMAWCPVMLSDSIVIVTPDGDAVDAGYCSFLK